MVMPVDGGPDEVGPVVVTTTTLGPHSSGDFVDRANGAFGDPIWIMVVRRSALVVDELVRYW